MLVAFLANVLRKALPLVSPYDPRLWPCYKSLFYDNTMLFGLAMDHTGLLYEDSKLQ